tara:strand:- start:4499 stop:5305 length:807 start_codon:yes stop_codon:yes gene_type:complete
MKVGKALYNILGSSKEIQENFPYNTTDYTPSSTELVTNGDFDNGEVAWTLGNGWSIIENKAKLVQVDTNNYLTQTIGTLVNAKNYKISFDLDIISATTTTIGISNTGAFGQLDVSDRFYTTSGTKTIYAVYDSSYPSFIRFVGGLNTEYTITNISIKEMVVTKIFPEIAPTGINAPYIVYSVVSNQPSESKEDNGAIDTASVEVYSFQDTYNKAIDLGVDVRAALKRVNGTYNTIDIQSIDYTNEQMDVNEKRDLWASIQDYEIRVKN